MSRLRMRWRCIVAVIGMASLSVAQRPAYSEQLPGRLITFKKTFDGWWDVACDTAPDGSDARCYVQYVDPYHVKPRFRAAMVDFLYRHRADGGAEPVITFDIEPDLSFARDLRLAVVGKDGAERPVSVARCPTGRCVFAGDKAQAMLIRWAGARSLRLTILEHGGETVVRDWPLGSMRSIVRIIAEQRELRGLP